MPRWERMLFLGLTVTSVFLLALAVCGAPRARADSTAYLIEVTVRPGYNFVNADSAVTFNELCPAQIWQLRNSAANYRPATG
jgi:hypothetical protein